MNEEVWEPNESAGSQADSSAESQHGDALTPPYVYSSDDDVETAADEVLAVVRDGLDQPIQNLPVKVETPSGTVVETKTSEHGAITIPATKREGAAKISVKGVDGKFQSVCSVDLAKCGGTVVVRSPKVAVPLKLKNHTQTVIAAKQNTSGDAWYETNGALDKAWTWLKGLIHDADNHPPKSPAKVSAAIVKQTASKAGNPLTAAVGPECPNSDNLRLGQNNIYREAILKAAKHCNMSPQAIAALIDAEAAKITIRVPLKHSDGRPVLDKRGKPITRSIGTQWDPKSWNKDKRTGDGAAGLTQFIPGTWLAHGMSRAYYLHQLFKDRGWVREETNKKGRKNIVFLLSDGTTTEKPLAHKGDSAVIACLNARFQPTLSIMAAADYAKYNLAALANKGFKTGALTDRDKAKLMYLMHHEGEGNGPRFIRNALDELSEQKMRHIFLRQLGDKPAAMETRIVRSHGDVYQAYRQWLVDYIDQIFDSMDKFYCTFNGSRPASILDILAAVSAK